MNIHILLFNNRDVKPANIMKLGPITDTSCTMTMNGNLKVGRNLNTHSPESTASFGNGSTSGRRKSGNSGRRTSLVETLFQKISNPEINLSCAKETLTGSIEFLNMQKTTMTRELSTADFVQPSSYKLIDLGTAVGVHEDEDVQKAESLMTMTEMAFAGYVPLT